MFIWILKIIAFLMIYPTSAMKHVVFGKVHGRVIRWNKILSPHKTQLGKLKLQIQNFYLLILTILLQLLSLIKKKWYHHIVYIKRNRINDNCPCGCWIGMAKHYRQMIYWFIWDIFTLFWSNWWTNWYNLICCLVFVPEAGEDVIVLHYHVHHYIYMYGHHY